MAFEQHADAERALAMAAYMKHNFTYYGIKSPVRKTITSDFFKSFKDLEMKEIEKTVKEMWAKKEREWHYAAMDLLVLNKKKWDEKSIQLFEYLLLKNAWWDSVDLIAAHMVGSYFKKYPENRSSILEKWINSENMWLQRVCLIYQLGYKKETDAEYLREAILQLNHSKQFFIQKAIGWALRQYAKVNPEFVLRFVEVNELKPLSKREAIKNIMVNP
ncbi:MAG TPA: DNA alkylation repair protein [Bacteroidia bacterium]